MPESSVEIKDACNSSRYRMSPLTQLCQHSVLTLPTSKHPYSEPRAFCTEENMSECLSYINQGPDDFVFSTMENSRTNEGLHLGSATLVLRSHCPEDFSGFPAPAHLILMKEMSSLGLASVGPESKGTWKLNNVTVLNSLYDLIRLHRRSLRAVEDLEVEQLKANSNMEYLQHSCTRLKDQLELCQRENTGLLERERQLQLKVKSLQNCLKNEKEEVQKHQNIIASRATQYSHDMKRKERELSKLKERLNQLLIDKKEKKQTIEVLNYIGRSDGKRSLWKTGKTEGRHEGEMYKTLLNDYDSRQRDLVGENAELKKVLQQMKKEMVYILSQRKQTFRDEKPNDNHEQAGSEEEEVFDSSRENLELSCEHAREKLTNSIRLQWRRLKSHMERLDSQASLVGDRANMDTVPREAHREEMDRLKLEIQQCKDFIHAQQQLLQQQLNTPCDEETSVLLNDSYMLEEKERLKQEWRAFEEQRRNFETERRNFTEAAIRLGYERQTFEEDRASWLKHQFLNLTPFADQKKSQMSKSQSALSVCTEPGIRMVSAVQQDKSISHATSSTPRASQMTTPSTGDLQSTLRLIPENSPSTVQPMRGDLQELGIVFNGDVTFQHRNLNGREDTFRGEKNCSI